MRGGARLLTGEGEERLRTRRRSIRTGKGEKHPLRRTRVVFGRWGGEEGELRGTRLVFSNSFLLLSFFISFSSARHHPIFVSSLVQRGGPSILSHAKRTPLHRGVRGSFGNIRG